VAFQDAWARPLAKDLVDLFRVASLDYIRVATAYDPAAGIVTTTETPFAGAGAVTKQMTTEDGGVGGPYSIECWIDAQGIGDVWPTTNDYVHYDGFKWKIVSIDPIYSGDSKYACKVTARKN